MIRLSASVLKTSAVVIVAAAGAILFTGTAKADTKWYYDVTGYAGKVKAGPFSSQSECEQNAQGERSAGYAVASCYSEGSDSSSGDAASAAPGLNPALATAAYNLGYSLGQWLTHRNTPASGNKNASSGNDQMAVQQQQAYLAALDQQRNEAERQRVLAEQQRLVAEQQQLQAAFERLSHELKLEHPGALALKGIPDNPAPLQFKMGDTPASDLGRDGLKLKSADASSSNNRVASSSPADCGPMGIAGLPGVYLDPCQTTKTSAFLSTGNPILLAQSAQELHGPEQTIVEDSALRAAEANPQLMAASRNAPVVSFQEVDADYQKAQRAQAQAGQDLQQAQQQNEAARAAVNLAQSEIARQQAAGSPTPPDVQLALGNLNRVAETDEEAAVRAEQEFDNASANLEMTRTKAVDALLVMTPPSDRSSDTSVVDLRDKQEPLVPSSDALNRSVAPVGGPITQAPSSTKATPRTAKELCIEVAGLQRALLRLTQAQAAQAGDREQWLATMDDATRDAAKQAAAFATEGATGLVADYLDRRMQDTAVKRAGDGIDRDKRGDLDAQFKALWYAKRLLEKSESQRKQLGDPDPFDPKQWKSLRLMDLEDWLDTMKDAIKKTLAQPEVQQALQLSKEGSTLIGVGDSMIDSGYNIAREAASIKQINILNESTNQYLAAVNRLKEQMKNAVTDSSYRGNCNANAPGALTAGVQ
jgi:hypothetical protein